MNRSDPSCSVDRSKIFLDPSLVTSCNLSWVGQVRPIVSDEQVVNLYPSR